MNTKDVKQNQVSAVQERFYNVRNVAVALCLAAFTVTSSQASAWNLEKDAGNPASVESTNGSYNEPIQSNYPSYPSNYARSVVKTVQEDASRPVGNPYRQKRGTTSFNASASTFASPDSGLPPAPQSVPIRYQSVAPALSPSSAPRAVVPGGKIKSDVRLTAGLQALNSESAVFPPNYFEPSQQVVGQAIAESRRGPVVRNDNGVISEPRRVPNDYRLPLEADNVPFRSSNASRYSQDADESARVQDSQTSSVARPESSATIPSASNYNNASGVRNLETLEDATRIALSESRTQRALALKAGASRSTVQAARSLRNPKVSNTTSYVGMLNRPTLNTDVNLGDFATGVLPEEIAEALAPLLADLPTYQIGSHICNQNFVATSTSVALPIYLGGRINALTRAAEAMQQAANAGVNVGEQAVKLEVSEAYFLVLRTRQLRAVAQEAAQTAQEHLADSERMFKTGLLTRNVVLAAQVAAAEARQLELQVANAQDMAESAYNRALWRPLDAPVMIADVELTKSSLGDIDSLTSLAVRSRSELQILSAEARALQEQEKVIRADVLPQVAAVGAYSYLENDSLKDKSNATASIGMTWTPFDGGTCRARRDATRQSALATSRVRDEAESAIRLQTRSAWLAEKEARERVEVARVAVEQAEENLRVVTRGFQEGLMNHTETLDAATMRTTAKTAYANAKYDAILAEQRLKFAVGAL